MKRLVPALGILVASVAAVPDASAYDQATPVQSSGRAPSAAPDHPTSADDPAGQGQGSGQGQGYFSNQLLGHTNPDGSLGNKYGYDPVIVQPLADVHV